jgi:hypothetical protein
MEEAPGFLDIVILLKMEKLRNLPMIHSHPPS